MSESELETAKDMVDLHFVIDSILVTAVALVGLVNNVTAICVLSQRRIRMRPSIRMLLITLACFDGFFLAFMLLHFGLSDNLDKNNQRLLWAPYTLPIQHMTLTGSVWTTVAISVERYLTVCRNHKPRNMVTHTLLWYILPTMMLSILFNIPRFFELHVHEGLTITHLFNDTKFAITDAILIAPTELRKNPSYFRDYLTIANSICLFIIPFILLILSNCFIAKVILRERPQSRITSISSSLSQNRRKREHLIALMLIVVVVVFLFCHSIRFLLNLIECLAYLGVIDTYDNQIFVLFIDISHLGLAFNSSVNLFIYVIIDRRFRHVFKDIMTCFCAYNKPKPRRRNVDLDMDDTGESLELTNFSATARKQSQQEQMPLNNKSGED